MRYSHQQSLELDDPLFPPRRRMWDWLLLSSVLVSAIVHFAFFYASMSWKVTDASHGEQKVETLFNVHLAKLESRDFLSRPTSEQLIEERERVLQEEIQALNSNVPGVVQSGMDSLAPPASSDVLPAWDDEEKDKLFEEDQAANRLISSTASNRAIEKVDRNLGAGSGIHDEIKTERIPLTGRGTGGQHRLVTGLPEPVVNSDPVVSRSLNTVLDKNLPPPSPDLQVSEPPIKLPPVTELLPSPDLINPSPESIDLKAVEEARQELKDRYINLDDLLAVDLQTYHMGNEGYFMVRIRPIASADRLPVLPKDVIFVLDASASMGNRRMGVILSELEKLINRLRPQDRFNVVGFKRSVRKFVDTLTPASQENVQNAKLFLRPLEASGKTDIYTSLEPLVQLGTERARPLTLFLVSDGRPTVGVVNSRKIINNLTRYQGPSTSIFCVGTGDVINRYLLDMLAFRNRGLVAFEQSRSDLPPVIESAFTYIEDPVLLQVSADFLGIDAAEVFPKTLPHLYLKGEIRIWGRLQDQTRFTLRLVGEAFDEHKELVLELPIPERDNGTYEIARQWAFHKIYNIVGRMVEEGERPEYLEQIRFLSRTYRIVTPYSEQFESQ